MKTSSKGIDLIKKYEGFRAKAYKCPADKWTIGFGHTLNVKSTDVITLDEAEYFLRQDVEFAEKEVNRHNLDINQNQFDALVSFVFNLGVGNFARSTLLRRIKAYPNDITIRREFARWVYAGEGLARSCNKKKRRSGIVFYEIKVLNLISKFILLSLYRRVFLKYNNSLVFRLLFTKAPD